MTDLNHTAICLLVDRSGSMQAIQKAAQDSINEFIAAQAARTGRTTLGIAQFDGGSEDWYLVHCPSTPAADVPPFTLHPRGMTALYDAMVRTIDEFGAELSGMPEAERPGTVVLGVLTDGCENASSATATDVRARVERQQRDYGWHVIYLGANQDAILEAAKMGVPQHSSMTYAATDGGTRSASRSFESYVAVASAGGPATFSNEDREQAQRE